MAGRRRAACVERRAACGASYNACARWRDAVQIRDAAAGSAGGKSDGGPSISTPSWPALNTIVRRVPLADPSDKFPKTRGEPADSDLRCPCAASRLPRLAYINDRAVTTLAF